MEEVFVFGANSWGQLGLGDTTDRLTPALLSFGSDVVDHISEGGSHSIVALQNGDVFACGYGEHGQLGNGQIIAQQTTFTMIPRFATRVDVVACGWWHTALLSDGLVYTWGRGNFGQLGHGDLNNRLVPSVVEHFSNVSVSKVSCGMKHTVVVDTLGQMYSFGASSNGRLGLGSIEEKEVSVPRKIGVPKNIMKVDCGSEHTAVIDGDGQLYTWGRGRGHRHGHASATDVHEPASVSSMRCADVACGWSNTCVLTFDGCIYVCGDNSRSQHQGSTASSWSKVNFPSAEFHPEKIASGSEHFCAWNGCDGAVYVWGWGEHGQLGLGNTADCVQPTACHLSDDKFVVKQCCAGGAVTMITIQKIT